MTPNPNLHPPFFSNEPSYLPYDRAKTPAMKSLTERPKSPCPERNQEIMQFIKIKMMEKLRISDFELNALQNIIVNQKNEMIQSSFEVYQSNKDEEDFIDTIKRILVKIRATNPDRQEQPKKKEPVKEQKNEVDSNKGSYFVVQKTSSDFNEKPPKNFEKPMINTEKQAKPIPSQPQNIEKQSKNIERGVLDPNNIPNPQINSKKNMLDMIFKTFFEETEEEFEPLEVGFAKCLYKQSDPQLIHVLNTCDTIPKAVLLIKDLAVQAYSKFFTENFEKKHVDYIMKNRNERSSEICSIIHVNYKKTRFLIIFLKEFQSRRKSRQFIKCPQSSGAF